MATLNKNPVEKRIETKPKKSCSGCWTVILLLWTLIVPLSTFYYGSYLDSSVCPIETPFTLDLSRFEASDPRGYPAAVNDLGCFVLHDYAVPTYSRHIEPYWVVANEKYEISRKYETLANHVSEFDSQYGISSSVAQFTEDVWRLTKRNLYELQAVVSHQIDDIVCPFISLSIELIEHHVGELYHSLQDFVQIYYKLFLIKLGYHYDIFHTKHILPNYLKAHRSFNEHIGPVSLKLNEYFHLTRLNVIVDFARKYIDILYAKGGDIYERKLQAKHHFLRDELYTLLKFNPNPVEGEGEIKEDIAEVVKDLLNEVIEEKVIEDNHFEDKVNQKQEILEEKFEDAKEIVEEEVETVEVEDSEESEEDSDLSDSEEEQETVRITSTITVVDKQTSLPVAENGLNTKTADSSLGSTAFDKVNDELEYWRNKVNRTCTAAWRNLDRDIAEFTEQLLESKIKPKISKKLAEIQQTSFGQYKEMNQLVAYIEKDSTYMQELRKLIRSQEDEVDSNTFVSRQVMRDRISESKEFVQEEVNLIKTDLTNFNTEIMKEFFNRAQSVIDILESFAELTIQEFSTRLHTLLSIVEDEGFDITNEEDEINWKAWKEFHKIKESIFQTRDDIFHQVQQYKSNYLFENEDIESIVVPQGLKLWEDYLRNIHFHANFLINDNSDYLRLARAKANVAYQLREKTDYDLEEFLKKKAEEERIEEEKREQEKREQEKREQEKIEQEKIEQEKRGQEKIDQENINQEKREEAEIDKEEINIEEGEVADDEEVIEVVEVIEEEEEEEDIEADEKKILN